MVDQETQDDFNEQVASFFRSAPTHAEGERLLGAHCNELLQQMPELACILNDYPAYGGLAFYGKMQFADARLISRLAAAGTSAGEAIDAIRAGKALRIAASAKGAWDLLLQSNPQALWTAIQLNLNVSKPPPTPLPDEDEDEDGNDDDFSNDHYHDDDNE